MASKRIISQDDGLIVRPSGPWIQKKYHFLSRYFAIFTKGMKNKWNPLTYIDLFAGPGRCLIEESGEEIDGSPLLALERDFSRYIFIEQNSECLDALKQRSRRKQKFSQIEFIAGDCNVVIDQVQPAGLTVAFSDPTGLDLHFDTLRALTDGENVDLIANIQHGMDGKRNLKSYVRQQGQSKLDRFLGERADRKKLSDWPDVWARYRERIETLGYSIADASNISVTNQQGVPMYFICFASKHPKGLEFWKKISRIDEQGQRELFH